MNEPKNDTNPQFEELVQRFANPPRDYSPVPIWWWSGERLERERLRWQLEQFAAGGVFNLVIPVVPDAFPPSERVEWLRWMLPPGVTRINLPLYGAA